MKTIQEAANIYGVLMCDIYGMTIDMSIPCEDSFEAGVEFAEKWLPIERGDDRLITDAQKKLMILNSPFLTKDNTGCIQFWECYSDSIMWDDDIIYWRPITRK